jgi:hypothetical protein
MHNPDRMAKGLAALLFLSSLVILPLPAAWAAPMLIGVEYSGRVVRIDENTGAGTLIGMAGFTNLNSLTTNAAGTIYSVGNAGGPVDNALIRIDPATGAGTLVATLSLAGVSDVRIFCLALGPDGFLYGENRAGVQILDPKTLWRINPNTGAATLVASLAANIGFTGLDFAPDGTLYGWEVLSLSPFGGPGVGLCKVNTATGAITDVNPAVNGTPDLQTICFLPDGRLVGGGSSRFYTVNPATGTPTLVGGSNYTDLRGLAFVPEPASLGSIAAATLIAASRRRRRWSR